MAAPGRILVPTNQRQLLFRTDKANARWYRLSNEGPGQLGVMYTDGLTANSLADTIEPGRSMDFFASRIEVRHDGGAHAEGTYEQLP